MNKPAEINPIDMLLPLMADASNRWLEEVKKNIDEQVKKKLDSSKDIILLKLLGFDKDYGDTGWRLDHCNGRNGNSAAGDYLREKQQEIIREWFDQITLPTLTDKDKASIEKRLKDEYIHTLNYRASELARTKAEEDLKALVAAITPSKQIENYIKLQQLIAPPPENN